MELKLYKHYVCAAKDLALHGAKIDTDFFGYDPVGLSKFDKIYGSISILYILIYIIRYILIQGLDGV